MITLRRRIKAWLLTKLIGKSTCIVNAKIKGQILLQKSSYVLNNQIEGGFDYGLQQALFDMLKSQTIDEHIFCMVEEMSELTKVLTKHLRKDSKFNRVDLTREVAHVDIMLRAIKQLFAIKECECYNIQMEDMAKHRKSKDKKITDVAIKFDMKELFK